MRELIDRLIEERSQGNPSLASTTRTKLLLKGIDSSKFSSSSEDDPELIEKLVKVSLDMGIRLKV
ncbi:MAG TPA: hypothetical protein VN372_06850 [Methanospirillum sp.]|nr:hypothetical protein [Methanospirillum sp.]